MKQKFNKYSGLLVAVLLMGACVSSTKRAPVQETQKEIRLSEDRGKLDRLRAKVPETEQTYNDETSFILNLFSDDSKTPYQITSKFNELANRKREEYSKNERKLREDYSYEEKKKREAFLNQKKREREEQDIAKMSTADRNRFFAEQDTERRRYFADEAEARRNFESKMRQERTDFEAHMRDMRSRFDNEHRNYSKTYNERKKLEVDKQRAAEKVRRDALSGKAGAAPPPGFTDQDMQDINSIPKSSKPIEPTESQ